MIHIKLLDPETPKRLAELPYYGWAAALIRQADPYWKYENNGVFEVELQRGEDACSFCGCDCNSNAQYKTVEIEAVGVDKALEIAREQNPGWEASINQPRYLPLDKRIPPQYLAPFDETQPTLS